MIASEHIVIDASTLFLNGGRSPTTTHAGYCVLRSGESMAVVYPHCHIDSTIQVERTFATARLSVTTRFGSITLPDLPGYLTQAVDDGQSVLLVAVDILGRQRSEHILTRSGIMPAQPDDGVGPYTAFVETVYSSAQIAVEMCGPAAGDQIYRHVRRVLDTMRSSVPRLEITQGGQSNPGATACITSHIAEKALEHSWVGWESYDLFAALNCISRSDFHRITAEVGFLDALKATLLNQIASIRFSANDVHGCFGAAYADCMAVLLRARVHGPKVASTMAKEIIIYRTHVGDFGRYSSMSKAEDTQDALLAIIELLQGPDLNLSNDHFMRVQAFHAAIINIARWMIRRKFEKDFATRIAKHLSSIFVTDLRDGGTSLPLPRRFLNRAS